MAEAILEKFRQLQTHLQQVLQGKSEVIEKTVATFLAGGHLLLEDYPGVGKTTLASAVAKSLRGSFSRIQFTADLLPGDVLGVRIYRRQDETFEFVSGPVFANIVLADELNRAPPKTQSALLQAMNEISITIDKETRSLPQPFFVIATQNPRGHHGTYPLPESQRDRFMMRLSIGYPDPAVETQILVSHRRDEPLRHMPEIMNPEDILTAQQAVREIEVPPPCLDYMVRLGEGIRRHEEVSIPVSPRGLIALMHASQALAYLRGRTFVDIDTIKFLAPNVLAHRINLRSLTRTHLGEGASTEWIITEFLQKLPVE
jgi:MoxR-like ATPase